MGPVSLAIAGTTGAATAAYLNARFHLGKDIADIRRFSATRQIVQNEVALGRVNLWHPFERSAKLYPSVQMIWSRQGCFTYAQGYSRSLQYANWLLSLGVKRGDKIGLVSQNSPDFLFVLLASWAIGCVPGLINWNLSEAGLLHCVRLLKCRILLVGDESGLLSRVQNSASDLDDLDVKRILLSQDLVEREITNCPSVWPSDKSSRHVNADHAFLMFTSGTTGLPKAMAIPATRMIEGINLYPESLNMVISDQKRDVTYVCLPLYHGTGIMFALNSILRGMTCALAPRFSASHFWSDVCDSKATIIVYVGETLRYLLSAPLSALDRAHGVRLMLGNGLRPDVWARFQGRFAVPEVYEFFASTEGMFFTAIYTRSGFGKNTVGHQGLITRLITRNMWIPVALDHETNDIFRDPKTGFAKRVPYDQGGEIIVKVASKQDWSGYYGNAESTDKKFISNVFKNGDLYYRTGDALRRDSDGCWYFLDRLGDTFRWKSENVSTTEVQAVIGQFPGVQEANVYGVQVPGSEGRAGCAALIIGRDAESANRERQGKPDSFDWHGFAQFVLARLPRAAVPVFIRVIQSRDARAMATHNNKQNKLPLRNEGVEPAMKGSLTPAGSADDAVFWLKPNADTYTPFGQREWDSIVSGAAKL